MAEEVEEGAPEESAVEEKPAEESSAATSTEEASEDTEVDEGIFGKAPVEVPETVQKAPEEPQKHYQSMALKGETFKVASTDVLGSNSIEELKSTLPKAIVVKKNLKNDVDQLYSSFKDYKKNGDNTDDVQQFKEACNSIIREAQKSHGEIKDKIHSFYQKS